MADAAPPIDPKRSILLVMDYQQGIAGSFPGAEDLLQLAGTAISAARAAEMPVGYVRVAFTEADYDAVPPANKGFSANAASRRMTDGTPETAVHPAIAPLAGDIVVRKTRVGAFSTTNLEQQLRERGIDVLVLAGIATSGVVLSTVRYAADRDFGLYVLENACMDRDPEVHDVLMHKVFPRQAYVVSVAEFASQLAS
jgi:nicotinamidase-related amidase